MTPLRILALCGSLRAASLNRALLQACTHLAPAGVQITLFEQLRRQINAADGLLIASPEYAHGVSGVMKNALDWLVATEALVNKPVAMLNAAPRAQHAYAALQETLVLMSCDWVAKASITVPVIAPVLSCEAILASPVLVESLQHALQALQTHIQQRAAMPI